MCKEHKGNETQDEDRGEKFAAAAVTCSEYLACPRGWSYALNWSLFRSRITRLHTSHGYICCRRVTVGGSHALGLQSAHLCCSQHPPCRLPCTINHPGACSISTMGTCNVEFVAAARVGGGNVQANHIDPRIRESPPAAAAASSANRLLAGVGPGAKTKRRWRSSPSPAASTRRSVLGVGNRKDTSRRAAPVQQCFATKWREARAALVLVVRRYHQPLRVVTLRGPTARTRCRVRCAAAGARAARRRTRWRCTPWAALRQVPPQGCGATAPSTEIRDRN